MRIPNGENAVVDLEKLTDYCLNHKRPRGKHKTWVFAAALGITAEDAPRLRLALLRAAAENQAECDLLDEHGQRYVIELKMNGPRGA